MILGVTTESWIESLELKEQDEYLQLVDALVISTNQARENEPPYYFVQKPYEELLDLLQSLAMCKAYPQRTLYSVSFSVVAIPEGKTPAELRKEWIYELRTLRLV